MRSLRALAPWLGGLAFFAGALAVLLSGIRRAEDPFPRASVFNESSHGLSLAYRYLRDRARGKGHAGPVEVLSRRIGSERLPADAIVFRIRPERRPRSRDEGDERGSRAPLLSAPELEWVSGGGRLVLGVAGDYGPLRAIPSPRTSAVRKIFPIWPGVRTLVPGEDTRTLSGTPAEGAHAIFASGSSPVLSRWPLGKGEVFLLSLPELFENGDLPRGDHLGLLVALAGETRPVFFDEWAQGLGRAEGLLDLMLEWGFGPAFVACALAFALWLSRARTRLGPEDADPPEGRSEAVDLVDSLAQLYDRALTRREAVRLQRESFDRAVGAHTGLKGQALARRAQELLRREGPELGAGAEIPPSEFLRSLHAVNQGYRRLYEHGHSRRSL
jgi:hypothetical protein